MAIVTTPLPLEPWSPLCFRERVLAHVERRWPSLRAFALAHSIPYSWAHQYFMRHGRASLVARVDYLLAVSEAVGIPLRELGAPIVDG